MKVLMINSVCGIRSTGRICTDLADKFISEGHKVMIAYGRESVPEKYKEYSLRIGNDFAVKAEGVKNRIFDNHALGSKKATEKFLKWAEDYSPDLLWLHNLHGYYINVEMLFDWIKSRPQMQVKWTLHDCWAFTGHCSHFSMIRCDRWKTHCEKCPQKKKYPSSLIRDNSFNNFERKKSAFTGVKNMTIITPSKWLADLVEQSFLGDYPIEVQHNTIDKSIFKPTPSDFRERYNLQNRKIVLGAASAWSEAKGLNDFIKLAEILDDKYIIVLVGIPKKQMKKLSPEIIALPRTNSVKELAEIYTAADIFVNPSREETFGLTTIEARACGTEAVVYKDTACEEVVNQYGGIVVSPDVSELKKAIETYCK